MNKTYLGYGPRRTPQSEPIPGTKQVQNNAGGFAWKTSRWDYLSRFLILGSEGGTYYVKERALTRGNAKNIEKLIADDGPEVVRRTVEVSVAGRAPKNDPALFVLAMAAGIGDAATRRAALEALPQVARTGTHLFHFAAYAEHFRGWGRGLRRAIGDWYNAKRAEDVVYQAVKYQQRDGWSHRDLLRLAHPIPASATHDIAYHWAVNGWENIGEEPHPNDALRLIWAFERAKTADERETIRLIYEYGLTREMVRTEHLNSLAVWEALLEKMPLTAMTRNLGKMSQVGLLHGGSAAVKIVSERLADEGYIRKSRLHPLAILVALNTYAGGHGIRGGLTWTPARQVVDALDGAFYLSFGNVEPTGKRLMLALDVSGSMSGPVIAGMPGITPRVGTAALAMVTAAVESQYLIVGFTSAGGDRRTMSGISELDISPRRRLDDIVAYMARQRFGGTDCALPMLYASEKKLDIDGFVIYTDNETWAGSVHPHQALVQYRRETGIPAKLAVVGMTATRFTIADPQDPGELDVVGFDTDTPNLIAGFISGGAT